MSKFDATKLCPFFTIANRITNAESAGVPCVKQKCALYVAFEGGGKCSLSAINGVEYNTRKLVDATNALKMPDGYTADGAGDDKVPF